MEKYILVTWIGDFYRPYIYKANINLFNIKEDQISATKLYFIDDFAHSTLTENKLIELYASPINETKALNVNSAVNVSVAITDIKKYWTTIDSLNDALFNATVHLNEYVEEVEECIINAFRREYKKNIEFLRPSERPQYDIYIGYLSKEEALMVYFTEYTVGKYTSVFENNESIYLQNRKEVIQSKIGTLCKVESVPLSIHSCSSFIDFIYMLITEDSFSVSTSIVERTAKNLATLTDYLNTLSATDLPNRLKHFTKLHTIRHAEIPILILSPDEGK